MNEIAVAPSILLVVFIECIAVSWFYGRNQFYTEKKDYNRFIFLGVNRFSFDIKAMIGTRPSLFWRIIWYLVSPIFLFVSQKKKNFFFFFFKKKTLNNGYLGFHNDEERSKLRYLM